MQKSSTVNFPSFLSAPYIANTLPGRKKSHDLAAVTTAKFNLREILLRITSGLLTCYTLISVNFALQFDSLKLILQDQFILLTDVLDSSRLGQQVVLKDTTSIVDHFFEQATQRFALKEIHSQLCPF